MASAAMEYVKTFSVNDTRSLSKASLSERSDSTGCSSGVVELEQIDEIVIAACDLDKTLYPPRGPGHQKQLEKNIAAMEMYESAGGIVLPVTGNNLLLAQRKFMDPQDETRMLRDIRSKPGIFLNGALALGPQGRVLERWALGDVRLYPKDDPSIQVMPESVDFVTALLEFALKHKVSGLLTDIGLALLTEDELLAFDGLECSQTVENLARMHQVSSRRASYEEIVSKKGKVCLTIWCWPWGWDVETTSESSKKTFTEKIEPMQSIILAHMQAEGLFNCVHCANCLTAEGTGRLVPSGKAHEGIQVFPMRDPWPSIDMLVGGVNKGAALGRFLRHQEILKCLDMPVIDPARQVAVFGDAPNDVSMFQNIQTLDLEKCQQSPVAMDSQRLRCAGGVSRAALRVAMPHADCDALLELSNCVAEVDQVLRELAIASDPSAADHFASDSDA